MRLLVTGGCGFIGTNFTYHMLEAHPDLCIINLDKLTYAGNRANLSQLETDQADRYTFVRADIADPEAVSSILKQYRVDAVVNFAAESHVDRSIDDPAPFIVTNVQGAQNMIHCAMQAGIERYVHVSTDEVYGSLAPSDPAFTEAHGLAPNSPYSASKASADLLVRSYVKTYDYPAVITRCSNNYGPYQFPEKLIPLMLQKALRDDPLPVYGDGQNVRDWIYVTDHCKGVELALLKGQPGAIYNFGGDAERTNLEVVTTILKAVGKPEDLISFVKDRPGHDRRYAMDFTLAKNELGFEPEFDFERGIKATLDWYADNTQWMAMIESGEYRTFMERWYEVRR